MPHAVMVKSRNKEERLLLPPISLCKEKKVSPQQTSESIPSQPLSNFVALAAKEVAK
jgi:hypothetical protein